MAGVSLASVGCLPGPGYSAPQGARLAIGEDPSSSQKARWACSGWDLVLADDVGQPTLYELNNDYAISPGVKSAGGTEFKYTRGSLQIVFVVPSDLTKPVMIRVNGSATTGSSTMTTTESTSSKVTTTESTTTSSTAVGGAFACPPAPPVSMY